MFHCFCRFMLIGMLSAAWAVAQSDTHDTTSPGESVNTLDKIIVTATRREQAIDLVSDDHSLINVGRLQLSTSQNISELLADFVPSRISDYGSGSVKKISLRGVGSERTLVLVDGKRIGSNDGDLGDMSVNSVDKIEVIEGGQSALYGMDAIGGVVNIITKQPTSDKLSGNLSIGLSSFEPRNRKGKLKALLNGKDVSGQLGQKYDHLGWLFGGKLAESNGKFGYPDSNKAFHIRENNGVDDGEVFFKTIYKYNALSLNALGVYGNRKIENPGMLPALSLATTKKSIGSVSVDGSYNPMQYLKLKFNSSYAYNFINFIDPNPDWPQKSKHTESRENVEFIQEFTLQKQMLNTGIQFFRDGIISSEIGNHTINQFGIFSNGIFKDSTQFFEFEQMPAIRFDHASTFGNSLNGKIGTVITGNIVLKPAIFYNIGNSFRAPSFNDLYWPSDAYNVGNPDLKPETSTNWDFGFQMQYTFDSVNIRTRFSHYAMQLSEMIIWMPDSSGIVWSPKNVSQATINGFKLDWSLNYRQEWNVALNYHYNDARNKETNKYLIYRPLSTFTCSFERFGNWLNTGISYTFSGKVFTNEKNTASLPYYHLVNVHAGYKVPIQLLKQNGMWIVYDMLNATNQDRSTNEGYPLPGREHRISLKMQF